MSQHLQDHFFAADSARVDAHDLHARAGLLASEASLLGLAFGLALATAIGIWVQPLAFLPLLRALLASSCGLASVGVVLAIAGRLLGLGATGRPQESVQRLFGPMIAAGVALAAVQGAALWLQTRHEAALPEQARSALTLWSEAGWLAGTGGLAIGLVGVAAVSLRQLAAWWQPEPVGQPAVLRHPVAHLYAAAAHLVLGGLGLAALIGHAGGRMDAELRYYLAMACATLAAHTTGATLVVLHGVRQRLRPLRAAGIRLPTLERGYVLAAVGLVAGVLLPALVALANLLDLAADGLAVACAVTAASNHAVRYGLVLLSWRRA